MNKIAEEKDFDEIKRKIESLLNQEGFDVVEFDEGPRGGGKNRLDALYLYLTIKARNSRGKDKIFGS